MLANMIVQHHNHPAVIIWGLGNENDWPNDFNTFDKSAIRAFMKELHDMAHRLDDTRMTAIRRCEFVMILLMSIHLLSGLVGIGVSLPIINRSQNRRCRR